MTIIQKLSVEIERAEPIKQIDMKQHDTGRIVEITLLKNGEYFPLDPINVGVDHVLVRIRRPDCEPIVLRADVADGKIVVRLKSQALAAVGRATAECVLYNGEDEQIVSSFYFYIRVIKVTVPSSELIGKDEYDVIQELFGDLAKAEEKRQEVEAARVAAEEKRVEAEELRVAAEEGRVEAEELRVAAEEGRVDAESARAQVESARELAEAARKAAEDARDLAEKVREAAENARAEAEEDRATEEAARKLAESSRVDAENARSLAEDARVQAEASRAQAESARELAEAARKAAEDARDLAENVRADAEALRTQAESERATAETARDEEEVKRSEAEEARKAAEKARADAEALRESAENGRVEAEDGRVSNENIRQDNERERVEGYERMGERLQTMEEALSCETDRATQSETNLEGKIDAETERATAEETELREDIESEVKRASGKEDELDKKIDDESARAVLKEGDLDAKIDAENRRASDAEAELGGRLDSETERATKRETELAGKISQETVERDDADRALGSRIDTEITERESAIEELENLVSAERSRAQSAESKLVNDIDAEKTRALAAEASLQADVDAIEEKDKTQDEAIVKAQRTADEAKAIAQGRSQGKVFDTVDAMNAWLADPENVATLNVGDSLLIKEKDVPDYWWDGESAIESEVAKVDLSDYFTDEQTETLITTERNRASAREAALEEKLNAETSAREAQEALLRQKDEAQDAALADETTRAQGRESELNAAIKKEQNDRTESEGEIKASVTKEAGDRAAEIERVEGLIAAEKDRASAAEDKNQKAISDEAARAAGEEEKIRALAEGKYSKPDEGIPSTDLTESVQNSLKKAESAIQSLPEDIVREDELSEVATSGSWNDLLDKPEVLDGKDGTTFTPSVSAEGVLSWTNDGNKQNPSPVNIRGKDGAAGKDGATGAAGAAGNGIKSITATYAQSSSTSQPGDSSFSPTRPTPTAGRYMWTKLAIAMTDGSTSNVYLMDKNGTNGTNGTNGSNGKDGTNGSNGADGARGSVWNSGTAMDGTSSTTNYYSYSGAPASRVGDYYLNTSNGNVYRCTTAGSGASAKWTYQGCIKGIKGDKGDKGEPPSNVMTTDTAQTVNGKKTFTNAAGVIAQDPSTNQQSYLTPGGLVIGIGNKNASSSSPTKYLNLNTDGIVINEDLGGQSGNSVQLNFPTASGTLLVKEDVSSWTTKQIQSQYWKSTSSSGSKVVGSIGAMYNSALKLIRLAGIVYITGTDGGDFSVLLFSRIKALVGCNDLAIPSTTTIIGTATILNGQNLDTELNDGGGAVLVTNSQDIRFGRYYDRTGALIPGPWTIGSLNGRTVKFECWWKLS